MIYEPHLGPMHQIEAAGATTLRQTVVAKDLFQNAVINAVQNSDADLEWIGEQVQLKVSQTPYYGKYYFNMRHSKSGTKHRRPYDLDCGIAFAFVVVGCPRFYYFSAKEAKKHHLVGELGTTQLGLPHPEVCAQDPKQRLFPIPLPATATRLKLLLAELRR
jgi:hypothetical protein